MYAKKSLFEECGNKVTDLSAHLYSLIKFFGPLLFAPCSLFLSMAIWAFLLHTKREGFLWQGLYKSHFMRKHADGLWATQITINFYIH